MKKLLQAEAIVPFLISVLLINNLPIHFAWWVWIPIFLIPDLGMLGYLLNNKIGAFTYNLFHHQLVAIVVAFSGMIFKIPYMELAGLVMLGHSSLDRVMGYGLKFNSGFNFTHLGIVGKEKHTA
ncbi:DUF4260 domain-containing protein [Pedobacter sp. Leaf170]|uniref:DUF4260 domain-containing protein n=1 Tax=Pedobacter sp. Leaf170 TaxID=2876558 RepID=UPI001E2E5282|nr:DUF4260 domain-containing protein [Pedobacter sp. Leaf170]